MGIDYWIDEIKPEQQTAYFVEFTDPLRISGLPDFPEGYKKQYIKSKYEASDVYLEGLPAPDSISQYENRIFFKKPYAEARRDLIAHHESMARDFPSGHMNDYLRAVINALSDESTVIYLTDWLPEYDGLTVVAAKIVDQGSKEFLGYRFLRDGYISPTGRFDIVEYMQEQLKKAGVESPALRNNLLLYSTCEAPYLGHDQFEQESLEQADPARALETTAPWLAALRAHSEAISDTREYYRLGERNIRQLVKRMRRAWHRSNYLLEHWWV